MCIMNLVQLTLSKGISMQSIENLKKKIREEKQRRQNLEGNISSLYNKQLAMKILINS